jgi:DNA-binding NtrC family response regulator
MVEVGSLTDLVNIYEAQLIAQAIEQAKGNHAEAARILKVNRTTLVEKRRVLGFAIGKPGSNGQG